jgi:hypothetical protein
MPGGLLWLVEMIMFKFSIPYNAGNFMTSKLGTS